jgi:hypothetical protein
LCRYVEVFIKEDRLSIKENRNPKKEGDSETPSPSSRVTFTSNLTLVGVGDATESRVVADSRCVADPVQGVQQG